MISAPAAADASRDVYDVVVIGAGPAGLAAALNLVRVHATVLLLDANRPRHAATLAAHGFITRDGISPATLRGLGREEFLNYPQASYLAATVVSVARQGHGLLRITYRRVRGGASGVAVARRLVVATGLREDLPALPEIRGYYGTALHSCAVCDGYEKTGAELAVIVHPAAACDAVLETVRLTTRFAERIRVFSCAAVSVNPEVAASTPSTPTVPAPETVQTPAALTTLLTPLTAGSAAHITVAPQPAVALVGERATLTEVTLQGGSSLPVSAGFVVPRYYRNTEFLRSLTTQPLPAQETAANPHSNIGLPGVYLAGEVLTGKPEQLLVAAGAGAALVPQILASM